MSSLATPQVLYEDNHLLVLNKPAGWTTQGAAPEAPSLLRWAQAYLKEKYAKPGNVFVGVVSRLDAPVSGVLVLARTSKAAARLSAQIRQRSIEKTYWAVVERPPLPPSGRLVQWLAADDRAARMRIVPAGTAGGQEARLSYRTLAPLPHQAALVEVQLETGRKHQIRVQLSGLGCPIWGDRKYGARRRLAAGIALHARRLGVRHPVRDEVLHWTAPLPPGWAVFDGSGELELLGG